MKVCLYLNAGAGEGVSFDEISGLIRRAGHHVTRVVESAGDLAGAKRDGVDCVVAVGGDGTIARAGRALAGGDVPLALLPLGTANNIASSLAIDGDPAELIAAWAATRVATMDVGTVEDDNHRGYFIEGVGTGLLPRGIRRGRRVASKHHTPDAGERLLLARSAFREALDALEPAPHDLDIDGSTASGESLLVEILNIATVGPRIRLSPDAHPADGMLSVVIAANEDRRSLAAHLDARWDDEASHAALRAWRAASVVARGWREYHVDDEVRDAHGGPVTLGIAHAALPILA